MNEKQQKMRATRGFNAALRFNTGMLFTNPYLLIFSFGMPILMYLMFGVGQSYSKIEVGNGNVAAQVLASMTNYGALYTMASLGVVISLELSQGWLRQIALTPLGIGRYLWSKILAGLNFIFCLILLCYVVGWATGAKMTVPIWFATAFTIALLSILCTLFGLGVAALVRGDAAFAIVGGGLALFAFMSGMFIPLQQMPEFFQNLAPYTPLYGVTRLPLALLLGARTHLEFWDFASVAIWISVFGVLMWLGFRRSTER